MYGEALPVAHPFFVNFSFERDGAGRHDGRAQKYPFIAHLARMRHFDGTLEKRAITF